MDELIQKVRIPPYLKVVASANGLIQIEVIGEGRTLEALCEGIEDGKAVFEVVDCEGEE